MNDIRMIVLRAMQVDGRRLLSGAEFMTDPRSAAVLLRAGQARLRHEDDVNVIWAALHAARRPLMLEPR